MSISTALLKMLAMLGLHEPPDDVQAITQQTSKPPEPTSREQRLRLDRPFTLAAHRSHSSHRSHGSHRSSSGSYSPGYSPPSTTPRYTPPPSYPPPPSQEPAPSAPSPRYIPPEQPPASRNFNSTPPSSVLPSSPSISPQLKQRLRGGTREFKTLVFKVQVALYGLGYYSGAIDGLIGPETSAAITSYQRSNGLSVTGTINDELLDALNITLD